MLQSILSNSSLYFWLRNIGVGGVPYKTWIKNMEIDRSTHRILDLGCGTCDIYRFVEPNLRPEIVVGVDFSEEYLKTAEAVLSSRKIAHELVNLNLEKLDSDISVENELIQHIESQKLNHTLLIGVFHHLPDDAILNTLNILHKTSTIQSIHSLDVLFNGNFINDLFARNDRGTFVRTEEEYLSLIKRSNWQIEKIVWSHPGISAIKYFQMNMVRK